MKQAKKSKKKAIRILGVVLAVILIASLVMVVRTQIEYRKIIADSDEAAQIAGLPEKWQPKNPRESQPGGTGDPAASEEPEPLPEEAAALTQVDLDALREVNGDVVGWIAIPNTELSYPLVQGTDNQYYLSRNWKREKNSGGSVFLESTNKSDLSAFHTIVYAHRMRNDTMFGTLKYYDRLDFWREHPSVYIVLNDTIYRYDIFSAQEAAVESIIYRLDLEKNHLEDEFLQYCADNSVIHTGLTPEADGRFLTLSTCTEAGFAETRWVVHGVLAQEYSRD